MGLFNHDNSFFKFVSRVTDAFILNLLWLLCSLPLVTAGAATCAAFSVSLKMVDDEEGYIAKSFFKAFRENFKQGTILWCVSLPLMYLLYLLWQVCIKVEEKSVLALVGCILVTSLFISVTLYAYPLIARYENSLKNILKNSFGIFVQYFGRSVLLVLLIAVELIVIFYNRWTLIAGVLIGPEFIIFTISWMAKRIFQKIEN